MHSIYFIINMIWTGPLPHGGRLGGAPKFPFARKSLQKNREKQPFYYLFRAKPWHNREEIPIFEVRTNFVIPMKELTISIPIRVFDYEELNEDDRQLIDTAREATHRSYSPYSRFAVGAAARLADGTIVSGSNQENAASPSSLCAERTTLFYANSRYPDQPVDTLAIAAHNERGEFLSEPIPPCGACRQVMLETEKRYNHPMRILLYGTAGIYEIQGVSGLLPLSFDASAMK